MIKLPILALTLLSTGASELPPGLNLYQPLRQGALVSGTASIVPLSVDGRTLALGAGNQVVFGIGRDQQQVRLCTGAASAQECRTIAIPVADWRIERVDGLPPKTVQPDPQTAARIAQEAALVASARQRADARTDFEGPWQRPAQGRISGVYGSQRVLNGIPGSTHLGLDIAAPTGTQVLAPANGIVSLVHQDMVLSGKTVLVDHGQGVSSVYIHLSRIDVELGQLIEQGDPIGAIGATGRASGPHLHWGLNWFEIKLDPASLDAFERR